MADGADEAQLIHYGTETSQSPNAETDEVLKFPANVIPSRKIDPDLVEYNRIHRWLQNFLAAGGPAATETSSDPKMRRLYPYFKKDLDRKKRMAQQDLEHVIIKYRANPIGRLPPNLFFVDMFPLVAWCGIHACSFSRVCV